MPLLLVLLIFKTGLAFDQISVLFPALIILQVVIPFTYLFFALRLGWVSKWDLPKREERRPMLMLLFVCSLVSLLLINYLGNKKLLDLFILLMVTGFVTSFITFFWKISIHMVLDTTVIMLINFLFGLYLWPLFLLIPVVAWARLKLGRHTLSQLIAGVLLSIIIFSTGIKFLTFNLSLFMK